MHSIRYNVDIHCSFAPQSPQQRGISRLLSILLTCTRTRTRTRTHTLGWVAVVIFIVIVFVMLFSHCRFGSTE